MPTLIPPERIAAIVKMGVCSPSVEWLTQPGRTYEDLAEKPEWALIAARFPGADVPKLQAIVIAHGGEALRRRFARTVPGADVTACLEGL